QTIAREIRQGRPQTCRRAFQLGVNRAKNESALRDVGLRRERRSLPRYSCSIVYPRFSSNLITLFGPAKCNAPATIAVGLPRFSSFSILGIHLTLRLSTNRAAIHGARFRKWLSPAQSASVSPLSQALCILLNSFSALPGSSRVSRRMNSLSRS